MTVMLIGVFTTAFAGATIWSPPTLTVPALIVFVIGVPTVFVPSLSVKVNVCAPDAVHCTGQKFKADPEVLTASVFVVRVQRLFVRDGEVTSTLRLEPVILFAVVLK